LSQLFGVDFSAVVRQQLLIQRVEMVIIHVICLLSNQSLNLFTRRLHVMRVTLLELVVLLRAVFVGLEVG
jgi:hypothetical protein